jgi:hypothetical protein
MRNKVVEIQPDDGVLFLVAGDSADARRCAEAIGVAATTGGAAIVDAHMVKLVVVFRDSRCAAVAPDPQADGCRHSPQYDGEDPGPVSDGRETVAISDLLQSGGGIR